jgi:hypothetical protein
MTYLPSGIDPNTRWTLDPNSGQLPPSSTAAHTHPPGDIVGDMPATGFVMLSANGSRWRITVSNAGALVVTAA